MSQIETEQREDFRVVAVSGEVDLSNSPRLREAILKELDGSSPVLVDLAGVSSIDSAGIAALVEGYQTAKQKSLGFALLSVSEAVFSVLQLARLERVIPLADDLEGARERIV